MTLNLDSDHKVVTRIAPSPTGNLQLGNLRTALFNFLYAKASNGKFILRIDDTDTTRNIPDAKEEIISIMQRFGLDYDQCFCQSDRLERYQTVAGWIGVPSEDESIYLPGVRGENGEFNMVLIKSDGYPSYNFASTVDDYDYDVTHIIRGTDHVSNLGKQKAVWAAIDELIGSRKPFPDVMHAGLLFDGQNKMSKTTGIGKALDYLEKYNVDALRHWLLKLGWSHSDANFDRIHKTISFTLMPLLFVNGKVNPQNCRIDIEKLKHLDKVYRNKKQ